MSTSVNRLRFPAYCFSLKIRSLPLFPGLRTFFHNCKDHTAGIIEPSLQLYHGEAAYSPYAEITKKTLKNKLHQEENKIPTLKGRRSRPNKQGIWKKVNTYICTQRGKAYIGKVGDHEKS